MSTARAERLASAESSPACGSDERCVARELAETLTSSRHALLLPRLIEFEPGRVRVYSVGRERIQALVEQWRKHRDWKVITVEGHAPGTARSAASGSLAQRRAERIRDYLVRYGVPKEFIVAQAAEEGGATVGSVDLSVDVCTSHDCLRDADAVGMTP